MVGGVAAVSLNRFRFPPAAELPARIGGRLAKADTAMFAQILRRLRRSIVLQIAGRRADDVADGHQRLTVQPRRGGRGDTQRQIDAVINKIENPILKPQTDVDLRVAVKKFQHQRVNGKPSHGFRHAERELALRHRLGTAGGVHGHTRRFQHLQRMFIHHFPGIAEAQLARGAVQQLAAHLLLQARDAAADRRRRCAGLACDGGEAALFHNLYEQGEVGQ